MNRTYQLPKIAHWPPEQMATKAELDEMRTLFGKEHQEDLLEARQNMVEDVLIAHLEAKDAGFVLSAVERICDAYSWSRRDPKMAPYCVHPYGKALLNVLVKMQGAEQHTERRMPVRGASDPKKNKQPVDFAFQLVRAAAIASKHQNTVLANIGLAQVIEFPSYLGQNENNAL